MAKDFLYGKTLNELQTICSELQLPRFVAKQIADWLYRKGVRSIEERFFPYKNSLFIYSFSLF